MPSYYESITFFEFQQKFNSEEACREKLYNMRWPQGFQCPRCGHESYYDLPNRRLNQCKSCKYQASVTAGTVMHKTRTDLTKWFWAIFLASDDKRGISALQLSKKIDLSYKVAWTMLHKIRQAMKMRDAHYQLAGLIQVDDSFFKSGPAEGGDKKGRGTNKVPVIIQTSTRGKAIEFAKMKVVGAVSREEIKNVVENDVQPRQTIKTDGWLAYRILSEMGHTHVSEVIYGDKGSNNHKALKWVHILASNAKAFLLGTYHGVGCKHLQAYLDEFCFRFNRRKWSAQLFDRLLHSCVLVKAITFAELTA
jgi:transposase-like protein